MRKQLSMKRTIVAFILFSCIGCFPDDHANAEPKGHPQRDQVASHERPQVLAAARKSNSPSPVVILFEIDPWLMVVGSDSPAFALYEDGTVIQRTETGFSKATLTKEESAKFLEQLDLRALSQLYGSYQPTDRTDQPEHVLLIYQGEKPAFVSVYGSLETNDVRSKLPSEIVAAFEKVKAFEHSQSRAWVPEHVEVMIWPYEYAPEPSIMWPKDWPGLNDPRTIKRGDDSFSVFFPSTNLSALRAFLEQRSEKGAIEIDGRKWAASIRFPFPQESHWMGPNTDVESAAP